MEDKKKREDLVDTAVDETFPASDPPSFMGGAAVVGPPPKEEAREPVSTEIKTIDKKAGLDRNEQPDKS